MEITDQTEADEYFEAMVEHYMKEGNQSREEAEEVARHNLEYYAGYLQIFGKRYMSADEIIQAGVNWQKESTT